MMLVILYSFLFIILSTHCLLFNTNNQVEKYYFVDDFDKIPQHRVRRSDLSNIDKKIDEFGQKIDKFGRKGAETVELGNGDGNYVNVTASYDPNFFEDKNLSIPIQNSHLYYNSTYYLKGDVFFIDISNTDNVETNHLKIKEHEKLSTSYKKAFQLNLEFSFPFYGNLVNKIVVTTGGFVNIGPIFHSNIHLVHYMAPLMANFNPMKSNDTKVFIAYGKDTAIIQWNKMLLDDANDTKQTFTFQVRLFRNGTIILAYKDIPFAPSLIKKTGRLNVTAGLADGFILRYRHLDLRRGRVIFHNYIYSYHKVQLPLNQVVSNAAFQLDMMESCVQFKSCNSCLKGSTKFNCKWCSKINLCSDTLDWHRQKWTYNKCQETAVSSPEKCYGDERNSKPSGNSEFIKKKDDNSNAGKMIGGIFGGILLTIILLAIIFFIYAYYHPQSKAGMWLIEHRPRRIFTTSFDKVPEEELL